MTKRNKVVKISLSGGLVGLFFSNPRRVLDDVIDRENQHDWNAIQFTEHKDTNLLVRIAQIIVLFLTSGIWTWGAGYLVLFERETAK